MIVKRIVVHCSATAEGAHYTAADIDRWHKARHFNSIGYHKVVLLDGSVENGRPENVAGAHAVGFNSDSLAVCYIGGCAKDWKTAKDTRTPEQKESLLLVVRDWMRQHKLSAQSVYGHYELDSRKACPSFNMDRFRAALTRDNAGVDREMEVDLPTLRHPFPNTAATMVLRHYLLQVLPRGMKSLRDAVFYFQADNGLQVDGICGPKTWEALLLAVDREDLP